MKSFLKHDVSYTEVRSGGVTQTDVCARVDGAITGAGEQRKAFLFRGFLAEHLRNASSRMPDIKAGTSFSEDLQLMVGQPTAACLTTPGNQDSETFR